MGSKKVYVNDLVTVDMIAYRRKTSVGHVISLVRGKTSKKKNFPQPLVGSGCRAAWLWPDVDSWFKEQDTRHQKKVENRKQRYVNNHN